MAEYISRTIVERGIEDAERLHAQVTARASKPKGGPK
jgi:hypothetical protein